VSTPVNGAKASFSEPSDAAQRRSDRARIGAAEGDAALVVSVKVAIPLSPDEPSALQRAIERYAGRAVAMDVQIDPEIIGGVWVRIGDVVIDGSLKARLESLRQHLCAQCRVILSTGIPAIETEFRV